MPDREHDYTLLGDDFLSYFNLEQLHVYPSHRCTFTALLYLGLTCEFVFASPSILSSTIGIARLAHPGMFYC